LWLDGCIASKHPLTDIPPPGDVQTSYFLPDHHDRQFPAGEEVKISPINLTSSISAQITVVAGIHNDASRPYNVSYIMGSLNLPQNNMYIQNFSHYVTPCRSYMSIDGGTGLFPIGLA